MRAQREPTRRVPAGMRILGLSVVAVLAAAGIAVAQSSDLPHADGNDSRSLVDISSVRGTHDRNADRLVHVVRTHDAISPRNFRNVIDGNGPPGTICVNIWTTRTAWEQPPNYFACVTGDRGRTKLLASVTRQKAGGSVRRAGNASAELTSPRRLVIRFDPDVIRRPAAYRWSTQVTTFERGCKKHLGCQDFAPKSGRSVRTQLGTPR